MPSQVNGRHEVEYFPFSNGLNLKEEKTEGPVTQALITITKMKTLPIPSLIG